MDVIFHFVKFLRFPSQAEDFQPMTFGSFMGLLLVTLLVIVPYSAMIYELGLDELDNVVMSMLKENPYLLVFVGIFIAPLLENRYIDFIWIGRKNLFYGA